MTRVALIGAGSVSFTRELLSDLFGSGDLEGLAIALHDVDADPLVAVEPLAAHAGTLSAGR
jgi:alpha-galactosidase